MEILKNPQDVTYTLHQNSHYSFLLQWKISIFPELITEMAIFTSAESDLKKT